MEQNRRFIYLRQTGSGRESGYARLENTEGTYRLSVVVQGFSPQSAARAALWKEDSLQDLGSLRFDSTGRGGLTARVLPEDAAKSSLLAVVREENGQRDIPLAAVTGHGSAVSLQAVLAAINPPAAPVSAALPEAEPFEEVEKALKSPLEPEEEKEVPEPLRAVYWPRQAWPMVDLFGKFPVTATPGGQSSRICVRVPLSGPAGAPDHYLLGVETENGQVVSLGMLLPGTQTDAEYSAMPDYVWDSGYWQLWQPVSE